MHFGGVDCDIGVCGGWEGGECGEDCLFVVLVGVNTEISIAPLHTREVRSKYLRIS